MKQQACTQTLYFLFRDLEGAYKSKNRGGFINYKGEGSGGGERRKYTFYGHHWSNVIGIANAEVIMTRRWHWEGHLIKLFFPKDVHRRSFLFFLARCQILGEKTVGGQAMKKREVIFFPPILVFAVPQIDRPPSWSGLPWRFSSVLQGKAWKPTVIW